ncbi:hypothetical protein [Actinoallomurus sp. CA-142502]|uniref:hypothetical protein n=1 Tax=Actinoallomurus sp. CA-142502 TaxID=3239885 RepID=UPI003D8A7AD5
MNGNWSPPIPTGADAVSAWRELDRQTRRDLLRGTGPHADPVVACVAVGYARTMLGGRRRARRLRRSFVFALAAIASMIAGAYLTALLHRPGVASAVPVVILVAGSVWFVLGTTRLRLRLIRMENVNAPALLAGEVPAPWTAPSPVQGRPLTIAHDRRATSLGYARAFAVTGACAVVTPLLLGWFAAPFLVLCAVLWPLMAYNLIHWVLPRRPVLVLDGGGVRFGTGVGLPWSAITEIRVHPLRTGNRPNPRHRVIAFVCADPRVPLASLKGFRRGNARRSLTYYGSPLAVASRNLDHTTEEIVAAAVALHPVPVRRFAPS